MTISTSMLSSNPSPTDGTHKRLTCLQDLLQRGIQFTIPYYKAHNPTHYYHGRYRLNLSSGLCQPYHQCSDGTARTGVFLNVQDAAKELLKLIRDNSDLPVEELYENCQQKTVQQIDLWWPEPFPLPMSRNFMTPLTLSCCFAETARLSMWDEARQRELEYLRDLPDILHSWQKARRLRQAWDEDVDLEVLHPSLV